MADGELCGEDKIDNRVRVISLGKIHHTLTCITYYLLLITFSSTHMSTLHIFNPSHDEALAANDPYYYPSVAARKLAEAWGTLPIIWAAEGDYVLLPSENVFVEENKGIRFVTTKDIKPSFWQNIDHIEPWGWDKLLRQQLRKAGASSQLLPTDAALDAYRMLSSRHTTARLLPMLRQLLGEMPTVGESFIAQSPDEVSQFVSTHDGQAMAKALWSCSGRGVFVVNANPNASCQGRINKLLREQGGIELQPLHIPVRDFALEFQANPDGTVSYCGLSLFTTTEAGGYTGNLIAPQAQLQAILAAQWSGAADVEQIANACCEALSQVIQGRYVGPLGIDMMLVRQEGGAVVLNPCIEVNLRHTMGWVALMVQDRLEGRIPARFSQLFHV